MTRHEREEYREQAEHLIEGLRRLAENIETPSDLLPEVIRQGEHLLPSRRGVLSHWRQRIAVWCSHPFVWAPALAIACFMAGVLVPSSYFRPPSKSLTMVEEPKPLEKPVTFPLSSQLRESSRAERSIRALSSAPAQFKEDAERPSERETVQVSLTLPAKLYEQLLQQAQQRKTDPSMLLREAIEVYLQERSREEGPLQK